MSISRAKDPRFESHLRLDFSGLSHTSDLKIGTPVATLPCQVPGVIRSVLGLVGPVLVYCDWVRWTVWSATSISVLQHVKLSRSVPEIYLRVAGTLINQQTIAHAQTSFLLFVSLSSFVMFRLFPLFMFACSFTLFVCLLACLLACLFARLFVLVLFLLPFKLNHFTDFQFFFFLFICSQAKSLLFTQLFNLKR